MPLNKLDNFLKNVEGRILYVSPSDLDSTDSITNEGNSQTQPFKTLQRAILEAARFSYQKGNNNDLIEKTTILLMPGEHIIDNRPGYAIQRNGDSAELIKPDGTVLSDSTELSLQLNSNFDLTQEINILYKFNSIHGGVIVPRGTSIVGLDLRKTKLRPKYVPNPTDPSVNPTSIFKITGGCYFWQFSVFDGDENSLVYTDDSNFSSQNKVKPIFSHHKLTVFEYADGVNKYNRTGLTDLDMYYAKLSRAYNAASTRNIEEKYPVSSDGFAKQRAEWEIVGAFTDDPITITGIQAGVLPGVPTNEVFVTTQTDHNLTAGTPIKIRKVRPLAYNVSTKVTRVDPDNPRKFVYTLPDFDRELQTPGDVTQGANITIETDTVTGASPYIFNCSLRSVYGMNGMLADGSKADGFRSMVVAQFTGVSLQKDDRAFVKYIPSNRRYEGLSLTVGSNAGTFGEELALYSSSTNEETVYHLDSEAVYRQGWETTHVKITNDAILQIVSVFAIGYTKHFNAQSGGDASITNSNSNFGQLALVSEGFKKKAFEKDDQSFLTHIIPPKSITSKEETADWMSIDQQRTLGINNAGRLYLFGFANKDIKPPFITQGFRIGAKKEDKLYLEIEKVIYSADIYMANRSGNPNISSVKEYSITEPASNIFTIANSGSHQLITGEKVRLISDIGDLPENIEPDTTYYVIRQSATQFKLAASKSDATASSPKAINVYKGENLKIVSRVTDKESGDFGHPIQFDESTYTLDSQSLVGGWYINVNQNSDIKTYMTYNHGTTPKSSDPSYFKRNEDDRSLDDKIYKFRIVVPQQARNSKNPENGFIIQESSNTGLRTDGDFTKNDPLVSSDYNFERNPRFISSCTFNSGTNEVTVISETPHNLFKGDSVTIKNATSSDNTVGAANSGFNGQFTVENVSNDMVFTYKPGRNMQPFITNDFTNRTNALPRFERTDLQSNIYIYRNEILSEYSENSQDGIYHVYPLNAKYTVPDEFTTYKYGQNVTDLYPQLDRDNIDENPESTISYAARAPLGNVVTNDLKNSTTRETVDEFLIKLGLGHEITSVSNSTGRTLITFAQNHGLAGLSNAASLDPSSGYTDGTYYNVKVFNSPTQNDNTWNGTLAYVKVSSNGIEDFKITNPGSGWQLGQKGYFDTDVVGGGTNGELQAASTGSAGFTAGQIGITTDLVVQLTGAGTTMSNHYKIIEVPTSNTIAIATATGDPVITSDYYGFVVGPTVELTNAVTSSNVTTFTSPTSSPHGLLVGNSFEFRKGGVDHSKVGNTYTVLERISATVFTANTGTDIPTGTITGGYVLKGGLSANNESSAKNNENLGSRGFTIFDGQFAKLNGAITDQSTTLRVTLLNSEVGLDARYPYGSYIQIDNEILRVASYAPTGGSNDTLTILRGVFSTPVEAHDTGSLIKKIKAIPIEYHRPSILRASGHTFEYLGYGPGNYSTALPQLQVRTLTEREEFLSQSQERSGGAVVYTGMNDKGDFYIGNQKKSALTGEEVTFDTPIPTIAGEDPGRLSVVFDEVTVKDRLVVEGGKSDTSLSQFDGPVNFNEEVRIKQPLKLRSEEPAVSATTGALVVSGGVGITGDIVTEGSMYFDDSKYLYFGTGVSNVPDLQIGHAHDIETNHIISNTGDLIIQSSGIGKDILLRSKLNIDGIKVTDNATATVQAVELYGTGTKVFETTDTGTITTGIATVTGIGTFEQNLYVDGDAILGDTNTRVVRVVGELEVQSTSNNAVVIDGGARIKKDLLVDGDITAYYTSDINLKENITIIPNALDKINSLSGNTFTWKSEGNGEDAGGYYREIGQADTGVIAQEIDALGLPGITTTRSDGTMAVSYDRLIPILIQAVKELSAKVDALS